MPVPETDHWIITDRRKLFQPPASHPVWVSHAQGPTVLPRPGKSWLILVAGRDAVNRSRTYALDFDPEALTIRQAHPVPALDIGPEGAFDADGVGPGTAVTMGETIRLYYAGARREPDVPYRSAIGVAESTDGGRTFARLQAEPILAASQHDPFGVTAPTVMRDTEGWTMWYSSFREWRDVDGKPEPIYDIRAAVSVDGLDWRCLDGPVLGFVDEHEGGLVRAQAFENGPERLLIAASRGWRGFRSSEPAGYRIVFGRSSDGRNWQRTDREPCFVPPLSASDWDGDMQSYPWLVRHNDSYLLFYNGNDFGRDGFGCAVLRRSKSLAGA